MNAKNRLRAFYIKFFNVFFGKRKSLTKSYISLFLVLTLTITMTAAWFSSKNSVRLFTDDLSFDSAVSMRTNQGLQLTTNIQINNFKLDEATSVDGRNIFLPSEGNFTTNTADMKFREANAGDRNVKFVYKDFTLSSDSASTDVYIKGYKITIGDETYQDEIKITYDSSGRPIAQYFPPDCPLRMAFIDDSGDAPKFIDPGARVRSFAKKTNAVDTTDSEGTPTTKETDPDSFSSYYYMVGDPIFQLRNHEQKKCTLVVWLEGTVGDCDQYIGKNISVDVDIESNYDNYQTITFVDDTMGDDGNSYQQNGISDGVRWIGNGNMIVAMSYKETVPDIFDNTSYKTVIMKKITTDADRNNGITPKWQAKLPADVVTDISFYRLSTSNVTGLGYGVIYNSWHTKVGVNEMLGPTAASWRIEQNNSPKIYNSSTNTWSYDSDHKEYLSESRTVKTADNEEITSVVYTARRGNGYSNVDSTDAHRMEKWLSPCIGYWEYSPASGGGGGSTPSDTTKYTVNISLNTGRHSYLDDRTKDPRRAVMQICINGTYVDMPRTSSNRFELNNYKVAKDAVVDKFRLHYLTNEGDEEFSVNPNYKFSRANNPIFTMNDNKSFSIS